MNKDIIKNIIIGVSVVVILLLATPAIRKIYNEYKADRDPSLLSKKEMSGLIESKAKGEIINGIEVPPMPDKALNDSTLAGVDSNGNGVRDDVERIMATESVNRAQYDLRLTIAKEYQRMLTTSDSTPQNINKIQKEIACISISGNGLVGDNRKIRNLITNNEARKLEIGKKLANTGGVAIGEDTCKKS